jgi:exodeoxyribonuclease X
MSLIESRFRIIDTETTGLDSETDRIVEVAAVNLAWMSGGWVAALDYESLINPGRPIPAQASAIHHLVDADVANAPDWAHAVEQVIEGNHTAYAAHHSVFDRGFCRLDDIRPWLCTKRLAMHLWPEAPSHSNQVLRYWLDLKVDLPPGLYPHRAAADAIVTAALLVRELQEIERRDVGRDVQSVEDLIGWTETPAELAYVPFGEYRGKRWSVMDAGFLDSVIKGDFNADILHTARLARARLPGAR